MQKRGTASICSFGVSLIPYIFLVLLTFPVLAGVLGTLGPAFGYLPALGGTSISVQPFVLFFEEPGIYSSITMSFVSGLGATFASFLLVFLFVAAYAETRTFQRVQRIMSPILSIPHASAAFGLSFLLAPSGLIVRLLSPWATGWTRPPDVQIINDSFGLTMILGLAVKEAPFLFLMALAALPQIPVRQSRLLMASLGYGRVLGFLMTCGPSLYRQLRLPIFAVLAFSASVADVAIVLGPQLPPTLAVRITEWMADPELQKRFIGSAGAIIQIGVLSAAITIWWIGERLAGLFLKDLCLTGWRGRYDRPFRRLSFTLVVLCGSVVFASLFALIVWSVAGLWPFPQFWPDRVTSGTWVETFPQILLPLATTLEIAGFSAGFSMMLVVLLLWINGLNPRPQFDRLLSGLMYFPLIVPQLSFVFGLQVLSLSVGFQPGLFTLVVVHMIFVLPYTFLSLRDPWASLDPRYDQLSLSFGKSKLKTLFAVRLPLLIRPVLTAFAVGLAVSIGLYLPTVLIGAGRLTTITTEAVALSSGGDRRVIGVYAIVQTILPFAGFFVASLLPALLEPNRSFRDIQRERR